VFNPEPINFKKEKITLNVIVAEVARKAREHSLGIEIKSISRKKKSLTSTVFQQAIIFFCSS